VIGRRRRTSEVYTTVHRSADRYVSEQAGIRSLHCFSAGAHYDADNTAFGTLVGVDEHVLDGGAGFGRHAHRDVAIVTWVLSGTLRHEDSTGTYVTLHPGECAVQIAGNGVSHVESNAAQLDELRFVQTTLLCSDEEPSYRVAQLPVRTAGALFSVHRAGPLVLEARRAHLFVARGEFAVVHEGLRPERDALYAGDSMRATREALTVDGTGELLVVLFGAT
jgi:redox-sensitive bicupin YhaK (pirin superfamily)